MPCYTLVRVTVNDDALTRKAVANLGLQYEKQDGCMNVITGWREKGYVNARAAAAAIQQEAGVLRTIQETRALAPDAVIRRQGNQLTVQVRV